MSTLPLETDLTNNMTLMTQVAPETPLPDCINITATIQNFKQGCIKSIQTTTKIRNHVMHDVSHTHIEYIKQTI